MPGVALCVVWSPGHGFLLGCGLLVGVASHRYGRVCGRGLMGVAPQGRGLLYGHGVVRGVVSCVGVAHREVRVLSCGRGLSVGVA